MNDTDLGAETDEDNVLETLGGVSELDVEPGGVRRGGWRGW